MAAKPLYIWERWVVEGGLGYIFRGSGATLNDFQMAKTGCHCLCMIKLCAKKCGRDIPKILGRPTEEYPYRIRSGEKPISGSKLNYKCFISLDLKKNHGRTMKQPLDV